MANQPYPWGADPNEPDTIPTQINGTVFTGPEPVGKYPRGASPFGVMDMVGSVWQMTDEYRDAHTRSMVLKGGANYRPYGSIWYFPQTDGHCSTGHCGVTTIQTHNKYFLMNPRYERCGTIGFRCAADHPGSSTLTCEGENLCGTFRAPLADVTLPSSPPSEWVLWDGNATVRSPGGAARLSDARSGLKGADLIGCNGTQSIFKWSGGNTSMGKCLSNGTQGVIFEVKAFNDNKSSTLSIYSGTIGSAAMLTATLKDGDKTTVLALDVPTTRDDVVSLAPYNVVWDVVFRAVSPSATLVINVSAPTVKPPPAPPSPSPAPCTQTLCGSVVAHKGDVMLSDFGVSDWTHYGYSGSTSAVNRKCNTSTLIQPLRVTNVHTFDDCPQTFSWVEGGCDPGSPPAAEVGGVRGTPSAIYVSGDVGSPAGQVNFTVLIPSVERDVYVYVYLGACGAKGVLNAHLLSPSGSTIASYQYFSGKQACQWTAVATLTIPPGSTAEASTRTLTGTWTQTQADHVVNPTNIQFHAIAVDAGRVYSGGGQSVLCAPGGAPDHSGTVVLQAAVLGV